MGVRGNGGKRRVQRDDESERLTPPPLLRWEFTSAERYKYIPVLRQAAAYFSPSDDKKKLKERWTMF